MGDCGFGGERRVTYGEQRHPVIPEAVREFVVPVRQVDGGGEQDEGEEGEEGRYGLQAGFDPPTWIVRPQSALSFGEEGSHGVVGGVGSRGWSTNMRW